MQECKTKFWLDQSWRGAYFKPEQAPMWWDWSMVTLYLGTPDEYVDGLFPFGVMA
jgi:hypothetical protein